MTEARPAQRIWEAALGVLQIQVNKPNYRTWLAKTTGLGYQDSTFVIGVPSTFVAEYLDKNQRSLIEKVLTGITHQEVRVQFQVNGNQQDRPPVQKSQRKATPSQQASLPLFNPRYTFDSFIVGSCNQLAYTAALRVAQNPGNSYNPLFIYGGAGLGKTHLLHAIGHIALAQNMKVLYVRAEEYTNQLIHALREKSTEEFRDKYRSADILLVDDVQFFGGKTQTEENFYHTFDELHNANRQIAVTSDRPPKSMPLLENRLRSRFEWGLTVDIQPPELETRLAILQAKAEQAGTDVPPNVLEFIAQQYKRNIRELEGGLNRVIAYARLLRAKVTAELAAKALIDIASQASRSTSIEHPTLINTVASSFHITTEDLISRRRDRETAQARQVAMYLLKKQNNCSLAEIGTILGGRNPSTVSHACEKIALDIQASPLLRRKIQSIQKRMRTRSKGIAL